MPTSPLGVLSMNLDLTCSIINWSKCKLGLSSASELVSIKEMGEVSLQDLFLLPVKQFGHSGLEFFDLFYHEINQGP